MGLRNKFVLVAAAVGVGLTGVGGYQISQLAQSTDLTTAYTQYQVANQFMNAVKAGKQVSAEQQKAGVEAVSTVNSGLAASLGFFAGASALLLAGLARPRKIVMVKPA